MNKQYALKIAFLKYFVVFLETISFDLSRERGFEFV
jgi:hypothetical protein